LTLIFLIKSETVDISNYTIKDIPGSTGRLDVISRCILAAIMRNKIFEKKVKIYIFLNQLGNYLFDPNKLNKISFPTNELLLSDLLVSIIKTRIKEGNENLQNAQGIEVISKDIFQIIQDYQNLNFKSFILCEEGENIIRIRETFTSLKENLLFIIGNQRGDFLNSHKLEKIDLPKISLGKMSYLASSCIRLIKFQFIR